MFEEVPQGMKNNFPRKLEIKPRRGQLEIFARSCGPPSLGFRRTPTWREGKPGQAVCQMPRQRSLSLWAPAWDGNVPGGRFPDTCRGCSQTPGDEGSVSLKSYRDLSNGGRAYCFKWNCLSFILALFNPPRQNRTFYMSLFPAQQQIYNLINFFILGQL